MKGIVKMKLNEELKKSLALFDELLDSYTAESLREEINSYEQNIGITLDEYLLSKQITKFEINYFTHSSLSSEEAAVYKYEYDSCLSTMVNAA